MNYIIIGASAAGLACAEQIRKEDATGKITVFTSEKHLPYSRPSISYYLKGVVEQNAMYLRSKSFYKTKKINILTQTEVSKIQPEKKTVTANAQVYAYDKLCICTGSVPFIPAMENVSGKKNVFTFLDLETVKKIKKKANKHTKVVVIGAGLIGMKAAEGLSKICKKVDVVELAPKILPSILDDEASELVKDYISACSNITFHLGDTVTKAFGTGDAVTGVALKSGATIECDLLIVAVGVRANTSLAESAGITVQRGILTDSETMCTSDKNIYAAGDCTLSTDMLDGEKKILALYPNAVYAGTVAGSQMAGGHLLLAGAYAVNAIDFYGVRICTSGLINATGKEFSRRVQKSGRKYKLLIFKGDTLVGFVLINSSENAGIYTSFIENKTPVSTINGDIMQTPSLVWFDKDKREQKLKGVV